MKLTSKLESFIINNKNDYHYESEDTTMAQILKKSKQRDAILAFLMTRKDHPTADIIYENVKMVIPNISLGTVYRNLALLSERGEILKLSYEGSSDRYDATTTPHYHFCCRNCKSVSDLDIPADFHALTELAANRFSGKIEGHCTYFYGLCPECTARADAVTHL